MSVKTIATLLLIALMGVSTTVGVILTGEREQKPSASQNQTQQEQQTQQSDGKLEKEQKEKNNYKKLAEDFAKEKEEYYLLLANPDTPLPKEYNPETDTVQGGFVMDSRVAPAAKEMIEAAAQDGIELMVCSAYRSIDKQTTLFNNMKQDYLNQGMSEEKAYEKTASAIAIPGTSEHQTGLAADIVTPTHQTLDPQFAQTEAGKWLTEHAHEYGFILRYPKDKQDITKIIYESWHFRFVGKTHAKLMKESGLCLEEYLQQEVPEGYTGIKDPFEDPEEEKPSEKDGNSTKEKD